MKVVTVFICGFITLQDFYDNAPPIDNQAIIDENGQIIPHAGEIDATQPPAREIQFALKFIF